MSLSAGTRLGPYEIVSPLGAGGMGEVYKARDTRLNRAVAVKVLASRLSASPADRQRFDREAKLLSKLSHPHVCALFDVGHADGTDYLVMELLDGEALSERLSRGPLPYPDVLRHGMAMADALDKAHVAGIVHRDLKPANVMLTPSGVKLLDFGLAKVLEIVAPGDDLGDGPTASAPVNLTREGALIGTLHYMAPEQVEGKAADARSDIFALGATLYQMATGRRPFGGESRAAVASAILSAEPEPLSKLQPQTPAPFAWLVRTCLEKNPERRWQSARDVALQLQGLAEPEPQPAAVTTRWGADILPWAMAGVATVAAVVGFWPRRPTPATPLTSVRFQVPPPAGRTFIDTVEVVTMALSPDGTQLVFVASEPDRSTRLWLRPLSAAEAHPVEGTEGAVSAFWSPDGRSIGFFARGKLQRLDLKSGGPALVVCDVRRDVGLTGTWGRAGQIAFASVEGEAIFGVSSGGGVPVVLVKGDRARADLRVNWPSFLPDGKRFFYLARDAGDAGLLMLGQAGEPSRVLRPVVSPVHYVASGHIVFAQEGTLLGQRFDEAKGALAGEPFSIAEPVSGFVSSGWASFTVSQNGNLVYDSSRDRSRLAWIDRSGRELGGVGVPSNIHRVCLSPDGTKALYDRAEPRTGTLALWTLDLARNTETRVTSNPGSEISGAWLPDQSGVIFSAPRGGPPHLYRKDFASGVEEELTPPGRLQFAEAVSPDGQTVLYRERAARGDLDVLALPLVGPHTPLPVLASVFTERAAAFSPDGRFLAFVSTESGEPEVYLRPFPGHGASTRVSTEGGEAPRWSRDSHELFYISRNGDVTSVPVRTMPTLEVGRPATLFTLKTSGWASYDVALDGSKFLAILPEVVAIEQPLSVILDWPAESRDRAGSAP